MYMYGMTRWLMQLQISSDKITSRMRVMDKYCTKSSQELVVLYTREMSVKNDHFVKESFLILTQFNNSSLLVLYGLLCHLFLFHCYTSPLELRKNLLIFISSRGLDRILNRDMLTNRKLVNERVPRFEVIESSFH